MGIPGPAVGGAAYRAGAAELARRDAVLAALVDRHGSPRVRPVPASGRFAALARSIAYQQLAGRAASAIHGRFVGLVGDVTPEGVLRFDVDGLMTCGLSRAKARSVLDLASHAADGRLRLERIGRLDDEAVIEHLTQVKGIGRWTAEMFLMFTLGRPDVWPVDDYGVRAGYTRAWGLGSMPSPRELKALGEPFRPYRSVAAWYCWRAAEDGRGAATPVTTGEPPVTREPPVEPPAVKG